jgi:6-phosphogluconolactonase
VISTALGRLLVVASLACGGSRGPDAGTAGGSSGGAAAAGGTTAGGAAGGLVAGGTAGGSAGGDAGRAAGGAATVDAGLPPGRLHAFVGSGNGNITAYAVDVATGVMTSLGTTSAGANPSFLAFDVARGRLYAVNEGSSQIAAFTLRADAGLTLLNRVASQGNGPAHVSVDPTGRWVFAANYGGGNVAVPRVTDGGLGSARTTRRPRCRCIRTVVSSTARTAGTTRSSPSPSTRTPEP